MPATGAHSQREVTAQHAVPHDRVPLVLSGARQGAAVEVSRVPTARPTVRGDRVPRDELAPASDDALRMLDTWGWLLTMADDLAGIGRALTRPPPPGAETGARENGTKDGSG